ncbi:MAG: Uma2 family endonuclease [Candidatus Brachytrichaceae bacterium NZ_4S206]|jgi:Uma2 family endonuclease
MNAVESVAPPTTTRSDGIVRRQRMSFDEFLAWNPEGGLTEWVNGEAVQYMPATSTHQRVIQFLVQLIGYFVQIHQLGKLFTGPYAMRLPGGNAREPDVFFVSNARLTNAGEAFLDGPADLVIEVVSDDSVSRDRVEKFDEYEAAGIPEYWVIDPRPHRKRADFFVRNTEGRYQQAPAIDGVYRSATLPGFWLKADWLWEENPDAPAALAAIVGAERLIEAIKAKSAPA